MRADPQEAGSAGEAEQGLCHSLDPPHTTASVWNLGALSRALSQEEPELRMQAGPAFCSWFLSIKKKQPPFYYGKSQTHPQKQRGEHDGAPQSPSSSGTSTCPPADTLPSPLATVLETSSLTPAGFLP